SDGAASVRPRNVPPVILIPRGPARHAEVPAEGGSTRGAPQDDGAADERASCRVLWRQSGGDAIAGAMKRLLAALLLLLLAAPAAAQIAPGPKVHARLIAERDAVRPGGTVTVALEQAIRPGWHTYWRNAGEAGAPTEIHWTLPPGWRARAIQWPFPQAEA